MPTLSIILSPEQAALVERAVASGDFTSPGEVVGEALRQWEAGRQIGRLWDEGLASGLADPTESIEEIKAAARAGRRD